MIQSGKLTQFLNETLAVGRFQEAAINGLQVQGKSRVKKVAFAVDGVLATFRAAAEWGADYLIVHHGLFWGRPFALRGADYRRVKCLINNDMALYAVHLPLDAHLELGHAAGILHSLGVSEPLEPFGREGDFHVGVMGRIDEMPLDLILNTLNNQFDDVKSVLFGRDRVQRIACITGQGAGFGFLKEAQINNIDLFISGETTHPTYHYCREAGLNLVLCGHYQTETYGLKSLQALLENQFEIETLFIDMPTGF